MKLLKSRRERRVAGATITNPTDHTTMDRGGAVRSVQAAYVEMPDFDGPIEFLRSLSNGHVVGHPYDRPREWRARIVPSTKAT